MRLPGPHTLFDLGASAVGWAVESAITLAAVPGRVLDLVGTTESLISRIDEVVGRADELLRRTTLVVAEAEAAVGRVRAITTTAGEVVDSARTVTSAANEVVATATAISRTAHELVELYQPLARRAAPLAQRFVDELSPHEIEAAIKLVDQLPALTGHLVSDVLPILATLDRVGPDVHQLLEVTNDVRQAILGIPGFNFLRRRGEDKVAENTDGI